MNLIQHFIDGKIVPGNSKRTGKVFDPATGDQKSEVKLGTQSDLMEAVKIAKQKAKLEASGGISDADNLLEIAKTGVDFISMGELTKNIKAVDLSLLLD